MDMKISALSPATTIPGDSAAFGLENMAQVKLQLPIPSLLFYGLFFNFFLADLSS